MVSFKIFVFFSVENFHLVLFFFFFFPFQIVSLARLKVLFSLALAVFPRISLSLVPRAALKSLSNNSHIYIGLRLLSVVAISLEEWVMFS